MAKKNQIFLSSKEIQKGLKDRVFETVVATAGGVAANFGYTFAKEKLPDNYKKFTGVGIMLAGAALNATGKHNLVKSAGLGIAGASGAMIIQDLAPDSIKTKFGLAGPVAETQSELSNEDLAKIEADMLAELNKRASEQPEAEGELQPPVSE